MGAKKTNNQTMRSAVMFVPLIGYMSMAEFTVAIARGKLPGTHSHSDAVDN